VLRSIRSQKTKGKAESKNEERLFNREPREIRELGMPGENAETSVPLDRVSEPECRNPKT
jgi:hypothetical protein